jgi:hypothetical protein
MPGVTKENIEHWFTYHNPTGNDEIQKYVAIRDAAKNFALAVLENSPSCPDQTVAIRKIREAVMTANAAIACQGK